MRNGTITHIEGDNDDRLYASDSYGRKQAEFIETSINDLFKYLSISHDGKYYFSQPRTKGQSNLFRMFLFIAANSDVEWAYYTDAKEEILATIKNTDNSGSSEDFGMPHPTLKFHSHPGIATDISHERFSMGISEDPTKTQKIVGYDWDNVMKDVIMNGAEKATRSLVYFPNSGRVYLIFAAGPELWGNVKKALMTNGQTKYSFSIINR